MIGEAFRLLRVFHNKGQRELAKELGVSHVHLYRLERGEANPSIGLIERYAEYFDVSPSAIMFFAENSQKMGIRQKGRKMIAGMIIKFLQMIEGGKDGL